MTAVNHSGILLRKFSSFLVNAQINTKNFLHDKNYQKKLFALIIELEKVKNLKSKQFSLN